MRYYIIINILLLLILSCQKPKNQAPVETPKTPKVLQRNVEYTRDLARFGNLEKTSAFEDPSFDRGIDVKSYELTGEFDWQALTLNASVRINLAVTDQALPKIVLDNRTTQIKSVTLNQNFSLDYSVDPNNATLAIDISKFKNQIDLSSVDLLIQYATDTKILASDNDEHYWESLRAVLPRRGDAVAVRTLNTMSEPRGASRWMPCHDQPNDRATFKSTFTTLASETFIANGSLKFDQTNDQGMRTTQFATDYSLPTYLMAFAVGEFTVATSRVGNLPIAIYARKGLPLNFNTLLSHLGSTIESFQSLVGPYGFEKYAIVFLPEFAGGEEHAGITFQTEAWGTDHLSAGDHSMTAHELAHQWFGDLMTVKNWDDLWIKEGMATLLESEAGRPYSDYNHSGRMFGSTFEVSDNEPAIDPDLLPEKKYTDGPYGRAGWILTQIRVLAGEKVFFATLRKILRDYAYSAISTEEFLGYFEPVIGTPNIQKVKTALYAKKLPKIIKESSEESQLLQLKLEDSDQAAILPIEISVLNTDHTRLKFQLSKDNPVQVMELQDQLVAFDLQDIHPLYAFSDTDKQKSEYYISAYFFGELTPSLQENLVGALNFSDLTAEQFQKLYLNAGSENVKAKLLSRACKHVSNMLPTDLSRESWQQAAQDQFTNLPYLGVISWYGGASFSSCKAIFSDSNPYSLQFAQMSKDPRSVVVTATELSIMAGFTDSLKESLATIGSVAKNPSSAKLGATAAQLIINTQIKTSDDIFAGPAENLALLKDFFRTLLSSNDTIEMLRYSSQGVTILKDVDAWPSYVQAISNVTYFPTQKRLICGAKNLLKHDETIWNLFVEKVKVTVYQSERLQPVLNNTDLACKSN